MPSTGKLRNCSWCEQWSPQHGSGAGGGLAGDALLQDGAGGGTRGQSGRGPAGLQRGNLRAPDTSARAADFLTPPEAIRAAGPPWEFKGAEGEEQGWEELEAPPQLPGSSSRELQAGLRCAILIQPAQKTGAQFGVFEFLLRVSACESTPERPVQIGSSWLPSSRCKREAARSGRTGRRRRPSERSVISRRSGGPRRAEGAAKRLEEDEIGGILREEKKGETNFCY